MTGSPPRPTPKAMAGRTDPARAVTPVDYRAISRRPAGEAGDAGGAADAGDKTVAASDGGGADPRAPRSATSPSSPPASRTSDTPGRIGPGPDQPSDRLPPRRPRTVELPRPAPAAPADAVHTLDARDPRPRPRPLRLVEEEIRVVGVDTVIGDQVVHTVAEPEDAWTADAGSSDHFLRGDLAVQVRRADNTVVGVFSARYALSVRPEDYEPALDIAEAAAGPGVRGGRGTRHPTTRRELLRRMQEAGFVVTAGSTHGRVSHPDHPGLFVPFASTPSDRRFTRHAVAQIRRVFGIDLRR